MEFRKFKNDLKENFEKLSQDATHLFEVEVDKEEMWNLYLDSFPEGTNEVYRERREYDCSACRHFIKSIGSAVVIKNNIVTTIWDFDTKSTTFQAVADSLSNYIKSKLVSNIYVSKVKTIGTKVNFEQTNKGVLEWQHLFVELPNKFVDSSDRSEGDIKGTYRDVRNVFKRSLDELTEDSVLTVLELIYSNTLYKGEEWKTNLETFLKLKREYELLKTDNEKENYTWEQSVKIGAVVGKIRNHSIGTLLINISDGMDLDEAVRKYEAIVAPSNYKRPKAIFTAKMLEDAQKTIEQLGYIDSLGRRYANLNDITVNNILFTNKDSAKILGTDNIFEEMKGDLPINAKKFSKVEEISIENFIKNVLPTTKEIEVLLENKHTSNMVSLIAPKIRDSKHMFKWNNNFSWAYSGNMTDSLMKERVKSAGGKVDGVLRFSIQWNDDAADNNDLDAHCVEPTGIEICYSNKNSYTGGNLDVDIINPVKNVSAVENITWANKNKMLNGKYKFFVRCFNNNGGRSGFRAEIEFDGQIYSYDYNKELRKKEDIVVAEVILKNGEFTIVEKLPSTTSSKEVWVVKTNQFVPGSVMMYSPNYWDEQDSMGHRHCFFMLKNCINSESPNGFYNEFLKEDLMKHKHVFEALGGKMKVDAIENQLSGVGFSLTKRNELIVKTKGQSERIIKIQF
jgi:hypothetical protein